MPSTSKLAPSTGTLDEDGIHLPFSKKSLTAVLAAGAKVDPKSYVIFFLYSYCVFTSSLFFSSFFHLMSTGIMQHHIKGPSHPVK